MAIVAGAFESHSDFWWERELALWPRIDPRNGYELGANQSRDHQQQNASPDTPHVGRDATVSYFATMLPGGTS